MAAESKKRWAQPIQRMRDDVEESYQSEREAWIARGRRGGVWPGPGPFSRHHDVVKALRDTERRAEKELAQDAAPLDRRIGRLEMRYQHLAGDAAEHDQRLAAEAEHKRLKKARQAAAAERAAVKEGNRAARDRSRDEVSRIAARHKTML